MPDAPRRVLPDSRLLLPNRPSLSPTLLSSEPAGASGWNSMQPVGRRSDFATRRACPKGPSPEQRTPRHRAGGASLRQWRRHGRRELDRLNGVGLEGLGNPIGHHSPASQLLWPRPTSHVSAEQEGGQGHGEDLVRDTVHFPHRLDESRRHSS
jgi:hypothetical protein